MCLILPSNHLKLVIKPSENHQSDVESTFSCRKQSYPGNFSFPPDLYVNRLLNNVFKCTKQNMELFIGPSKIALTYKSIIYDT